MREIGKRVRLRSVDMGYSASWAGRIMAMANALKFDLELLRVSDLIQLPSLHERARRELLVQRAYLDLLEVRRDANVTPCTNCYNCKILAITHGSAQDQDKDFIFFGHHSSDLLSSFLKSCIMYYDRWVDGHISFDRENYVKAALRVGDDLAKKDSAFLEIFLRYLKEGFASTEEPAYELKTLHGVKYAIGRPMIQVSEDTVRAYCQELGVGVESSGCGHTLASETRTPREIVQYEVLPIVLRGHHGRENLARIKCAVIESLNFDGSLKADARAGRSTLLGSAYKDGDQGMHVKF
jgi:tRNA(Ile)-lysidine synthase TilS/MesJ